MAEEFTLAPMRRLIKRHGDLRVSEEAGEELRRVIGDYGSRVAEAAVAHAREEGRRTVLARDVRAALRRVEGAAAGL
ncbi:MAG: NFYB/HAP3 family transcription factor subunit [Candidatus Bathyarchaeota archaeon]|nr:NFYB/HAP3 family transcription factor subunit [Candidatus Bathyarchaeota archaeon]